jgi:hypothetical protein
VRIDLQYARMAEGRLCDIKPGTEIFVVMEKIFIFIGEYKLPEGCDVGQRRSSHPHYRFCDRSVTAVS